MSAIWAIDTEAIKEVSLQVLVEHGIIPDPTGREFSFGALGVFTS
jgi:hypothetical protein